MLNRVFNSYITLLLTKSFSYKMCKKNLHKVKKFKGLALSNIGLITIKL